MNILAAYCIVSILGKLGVFGIFEVTPAGTHGHLKTQKDSGLGILCFLVPRPYGASKCQHNHYLINSFISQIFECLLCVSYCTKHQKY